MSRDIEIRVTNLVDGRVSLECHLREPHKGARGIRRIALWSMTRRTTAPYASELTPALAAELTTAIQLVLAGWYENPELPF
jgi:hypothetical protein